MISDRRLITIFLLAAICLLPLACGVRVSISSDAGSISEEISASNKDAVKSSTAIGADSLSHFIEGSGSFKDSHSVSNKAGANAGVSVDIRNAEKYSYDYYLSADKASKSAPVMAGEELDVLNAKYIQASAKASNEKGYKADVSTVIRDPGNLASLTGYQNIAMASKDEAMASQIAESASAPNGYILADSIAGFTQLKSKPLQFWEDEANEGVQIDYGSIEGYSDLASASANGVMASQQMVAAMGNQIQTKSQSESLTASLFQSLKKTDAKVGSTVEGTLAGYNGSAYASKNYAEAGQTGHVRGTFSSTALAGKERKTRNSNYPEYDFEMKAKKGAAGSSASGALEFYVDDDDPNIGSIQGAVDASDSGDAVNVAPGTYYENVQIDKSLAVKGAGASDTIVDGQQAGSVFTIGRDSPNADVTLSGMTIQGGSGTPWADWPGYIGGGILNFGTLELIDSTISGNGNTEFQTYGGGGIYNFGTVTVTGSTISGNQASDGAGICSSGAATISNSILSNNIAGGGGAITNDRTGTLDISDSTLSENTAGWAGGAILNWGAIATITNCTISGNDAGDGGGIYTSDSWDGYNGLVTVTGSTISGNTANNGGGICALGTATLNISDDAISENIAYNGGGILNSGTATITGSTISENNADYGGGIFNNGEATITGSNISGNAASGDGGGISNYGTVDVTGSIISENTATYGGGIFNNGEATITGSNISRNAASGDGGGISNYGTVDVIGCNISENTAVYGGGFFNSYGGTATATVTGSIISENIAYAIGGGIYNDCMATVTDNTILRNTASGSGGGIFNGYNSRSSVMDNIISGNIATHGEGGGVYIGNTGDVVGNTISENTAENSGGGIFIGGVTPFTATIAGNNISRNFADGAGGGIFNGATTEVTGNSISGNTANWYGGGGICNGGLILIDGSNILENTASRGGGIFNYGEVMVTGSNISRNTAENGGGIFNTLGPVTVVGTNVSENAATGWGGGIYNDYSGTINLQGGSIFNNTASFGSGIYNSYYGTVNLNDGSIDHNTAYHLGGGIYNDGTITGNKNLVHDNVPDQIYDETINPGDGDPGIIHVEPGDGNADPGNDIGDPISNEDP